jgi:hypothetical protein
MDPDELSSMDTVMHVWDILEGATYHPTLYKVGHITGFTDEHNANVTYYKSTYRRVEMWEGGARRSLWTRAIETKEVLPVAQLAVMYTGNHRDWNCFLRQIKNMAGQVEELKERLRVQPPTADEIDDLDDADFMQVKELLQKSRHQAVQDTKLTDEWIMTINGQAEKLIRIWNSKRNNSVDTEGLWYHLSHVANEFDWYQVTTEILRKILQRIELIRQ